MLTWWPFLHFYLIAVFTAFWVTAKFLALAYFFIKKKKEKSSQISKQVGFLQHRWFFSLLWWNVEVGDYLHEEEG